VVGLLR
jgi:ABC-type uncharacterized transport system ATPase subunit